MNLALRYGKTSLTWGLLVSTIAWSMGLAALLTPLATQAVASGDLIKASTAAVYYYGEDGKRYVFPNQPTYNTWYADFSGVVIITDAELAAIPIGGNVTYKPGVRMVKITTDPKVYVVDAGGTLRPIADEAEAVTLYGADWNTMIDDVADSFFTNYTVGGDATGFDKAAAMTAATSINDDKNLSAGPTATGSLTVALAATTPASSALPFNSQGFRAATILITAGSEAGEITGFTVDRYGLGSASEISKVYVEVNGERKGSKRSLNNEDPAEINLASVKNRIAIPANGSVLIDFMFDMGSTAADSGHQHGIVISAIQSNGSVSASLPIKGNLHSITSVAAPTASLNTTTVNTQVDIGENQVAVGAIKIENTAANSEHIYVTIIGVKNTGDAADDDATNFTLYDDTDTVVAGPLQMVNDRLTFNIGMYEIADGKSEKFTIKADIKDGRAKTLIFEPDKVTDVKGIGFENGFTVTFTDKASVSTVTIQSGDLSIDEHSSNPSSQDAAPDADDVVFLAAEFVADEETVNITSLQLTITGTATDLDNITVKVDGVTVAGPTDATGSTITFTDEFEISGTQVVTIEADLGSSASGTYSISIASGGATAESLDGDALTESGSADGATVTVGTGAPTIALDNSYGNQTVVMGQDGVLLARFIVEGSDFEGATISNYDVTTAFTGAGIDANNITRLWISEDNDVITSVSSSTDNNFVVSNNIAANEQVVVSVYADLDSESVTGTIVVTLGLTATGLTSDDETTVTNITGQTITIGAGGVAVAIAAAQPDRDIVIPSASSMPVGMFKWTSTNVGFTVTEAVFRVYDDGAITATNTSAVISLTFDDTTKAVANGEVTFNNTSVVVPKDNDITETISAVFNTDFNTISSGASVEFVLYSYKYIPNNDTAELEVFPSALDTDEPFTLRSSRPVITTSAGDANGTLVLGDNDLFDITITADASGQEVTVNTTTVEIASTSGVTVSGVTLWYKGTNTLISTGVASTTVDTAWEFDMQTTDGVQEIGSGLSRTYEVRVTTSDVTGADQSISGKLLGTANTFSWRDDETTAAIENATDLDTIPSGTFSAKN